jgi:hypothetical protein
MVPPAGRGTCHHIKQPTVEGATQPPILDAAETEVGATMRAIVVEEAMAAFVIAEQDEGFAKQPDAGHWPYAVQLVDQGGRLPVATEQDTELGPRPGAGNQFVPFSTDHWASLFNYRTHVRILRQVGA